MKSGWINSEYDARDSIIARGDEMIALLEQLEERDTVYVAVV